MIALQRELFGECHNMSALMLSRSLKNFDIECKDDRSKIEQESEQKVNSGFVNSPHLKLMERKKHQRITRHGILHIISRFQKDGTFVCKKKTPCEKDTP